MRKGKIIHKWNRPKEIDHELSDLLIKTGQDMLPRLILVMGIILLSLYFFLRWVVPEEVLPNVKKVFVFCFFFSLFLPCGFIVQGLLKRYIRTKYEICEKKILEGDFLNTETISWGNIRGYSYSDDEKFPSIISIMLHLKTKKKKVFWVPKGKISERVVRTFSNRCPLISEVEGERRSRMILSKWQYLYLLATTLTYSVLVGYFIHKNPPRFPLGLVLILVVIIFGPGTLACFFMYGTKMVKDKIVKGCAFFFNFAALVFIMLFWMLFEFYYWSEVIRKLTEESASGVY